MLANLLLPLLLVACGQAQQPPDSSPGRSVAVDWPGMPNMAVDTTGDCNCACASKAEVRMAYQTKYNACSGRADRQRLCRNATGRGQDPKPPVHPPLQLGVGRGKRPLFGKFPQGGQKVGVIFWKVVK